MFTRAEFCESVCLLEQLSACQCVLVREKALRKRVCNRKYRRGPQVPRPCHVGGDSRPVQVETAYQLGLAPRAHDHRCVGAVYYVQIRKSEQRTPLHLRTADLVPQPRTRLCRVFTRSTPLLGRPTELRRGRTTKRGRTRSLPHRWRTPDPHRPSSRPRPRRATPSDSPRGPPFPAHRGAGLAAFLLLRLLGVDSEREFCLLEGSAEGTYNTKHAEAARLYYTTTYTHTYTPTEL